MAPKPVKGAPPPAEPEEEATEKFGEWLGKDGLPESAPRDKDSQLPNGEGVAVYPNGDRYTGRIENSERVGKGKYVWKAAEEGKHGGEYDGEYKSNKKEGKGKMVYPDTGTYDGQWTEGLREGQGTFKYPNGDWYKGMWLKGKKSARGTYFSYSGACWYMGLWTDGNFVEGDWKFKDGSCYKGNFAAGMPAPGEGSFVFPNGNTVKGTWVAKALEGEALAAAQEGGKPTSTVSWVGGEVSYADGA
mmetsp:Transcript_26541/g.39042  ORF Transcript_26541/g.39042 Transcript_26541/m.39042 type:complete len:245 (+) Transcript_26541:33-767(+)